MQHVLRGNLLLVSGWEPTSRAARLPLVATSQGIGRAVVEELLSLGARVLYCSRNPLGDTSNISEVSQLFSSCAG